MTRLKVSFRRLLRTFFSRRELDRELDEEIRTHLEMQREENTRLGMSAEEAHYEALRQFGGVEQVKERYRLKRGLPMVETTLQDLRYGLRSLRKNPGFTAVAVITLSLGIGANSAIFSVVSAVLLRPLPFKESERLVMVWNRGAEAAGGDRTPLAPSDLLDWRAQKQQSHSFAEIGAFQRSKFNYTGGESPVRVQAAGVTSNFFSVLGVDAQHGRTFLPEEERPGAPRVALISDGFWRKHFAADPRVLGRTLNLNGELFTIIGIVPAALDFPDKDVEIWTAIQLEPPARRGPYFLTGVARLKPGVSLAQARAELSTLRSSFGGEQINFNVLPVNEFIVGDVRLALLVLLAAVTLVLLIAAVNVTNLTLVRSAARAKEISIRTALGAGRRRIVRQLLTESLLLAFAGGVLGVLLGTWGVRALLKLTPETLPRLHQIGIDWHVLGWTALVSLLTGVLFGLAPAWQSSRLDLNESLKEGARGATEGAGKRRWRDLLVVSELALAVMLLVGAGLLVTSFWHLQRVDPGVNTERVLTMQLAPRGGRYNEPQQVRALYERLLAQVQALPGVRAAAVSNSLPPDNTEYSDDLVIEGRPANGPERPPPIAYMIQVSPEYFGALGLPLHRGRYFKPTDLAEAPRVLLVNETAARRFFPGEEPLGKRINRGSEREPVWCEIVGVVGDAKYNGLADEVQPALYQPLAQVPSWDVFLLVKTETADPTNLIGAVRGEIKAIDSELPVSEVRTLEQHFSGAVAEPRFRTALVALFAALALALAAIGIYGVISYSVSRRTHEIGLRMALGARGRDVLAMVIGQGMRLALAGVGLGLLAAFALTRLMQSLLFNVSAADPLTYIVISLVIIVTALLASYLPARRATRVDPLIALRHE